MASPGSWRRISRPTPVPATEPGRDPQDLTPPRLFQTHKTRVATRGELEGLMGHLLDELDACGFLRNEAKRPGMVRNLRHWFTRGEITEQEVRTLHGVVAELSRGRMRHGRP